jgi:hypothetical protein
MSTFHVKSAVKHNGTLYKPGEQVELSDDVARALIEAGVVEGGEEPDTAPDTAGDDVSPLASLSYRELQERAASFGLPAVGVSKNVLIERITAAMNAPNTKPEGGNSEPPANVLLDDDDFLEDGTDADNEDDL